MTLRSDLRTEVMNRLNDPSNTLWTLAEINGYINQAIKSLYPTYFQYEVATTAAGAGPIQTMPAGASNLYYIGLQKAGTTRPRMMRQWREGDGTAFVPKTGITGETLVWAWTAPFASPSDDNTALTLNPECEEVVVLRVQITALENIVSSRVNSARYFALTVREGVTEQDLTATLDALHASLQQRMSTAVKRPDRQG